MPRTVSGPGGRVDFTNPQYGLALKLAFDHGWKPAGTLPPPAWDLLPENQPDKPGGRPRHWPSMNYFAGRGERVTSADALAIAAALESVLDDIPNHDAFSHKVISRIDMPYADEQLQLAPGEKLSYFEFFSGPHKELLRRFIGLCRTGGFAVTGA